MRFPFPIYFSLYPMEVIVSNHCLSFIAAFIDYATILFVSPIIPKAESTYEQLQSNKAGLF